MEVMGYAGQSIPQGFHMETQEKGLSPLWDSPFSY